jgi:hypothetical protein
MRFFFAPLLLVACGTPLLLTPATGHGTPYPCGVGGAACGGDMCCSEGFICGNADAFVACPVGMCCWVGESMAPDGGRPPNVPQRSR